MTGLNNLLLQQEENQAQEKVKFMEELSKQFNIQSSLQMDAFQTMKSFDVERKAYTQQVACVDLFERFRKLRLVRSILIVNNIFFLRDMI